ncbi:hypothetical protein HanPSC8_Chr10g0415591 [Helianthus annuus]|nr:hypothetical protein HanPSC8_Chr10g0415591 [Helianthus annuus]
MVKSRLSECSVCMFKYFKSLTSFKPKASQVKLREAESGKKHIKGDF